MPETLPTRATRRPMRPFLQAPSRTRLRWLTLTAALPLVTALVLLPMHHYLDTKAKSKENSAAEPAAPLSEGARAVRHFRSFVDFLPVNPNATREKWFGSWHYRIEIWDVKRGHYVGTWAKGNLDPDSLRHHGTLALADGTIYRRSQDHVETQQRDANVYKKEFRTAVRDLFELQQMTARISGYSEPVSVGKPTRGTYAKMSPPRMVEIRTCIQHPSREKEKEGAPIILVRFYRDLKTGLVYGYDALANWPRSSDSTSHRNRASQEIGGGTFEYSSDAVKDYGGRILDKKYFLENAG